MEKQSEPGINKTRGVILPDLERGLEYFSKLDWAKELINNDNYEPVSISFREGIDSPGEDTFFGSTLKTPQTLSHWICLLHRTFPDNIKDRTLTEQNPHPQPPSPKFSPDCIFLVNLGTGLWGFRDTMHGGAICSILDQTMSLCAGAHRKRVPEVGGNLHTATLQVDFRKPVIVPEVVYVECWMEYRDRRKWMIKGCIKDASGTVLAEGKGLWVLTRVVELSRL
jgi:hypothetical protein